MGHDLLGKEPDFGSSLSLPSPVAIEMGPAAALQSLACHSLDVHHFVPSLIQHVVMSNGAGHTQQVLLFPHGHQHCRWYAPEHPRHPLGILSLYCAGCCMSGLIGCQQHMSLHSHQWIPKAGPSSVADLQDHPIKSQTFNNNATK
jgi:hypothetical protein